MTRKPEDLTPEDIENLLVSVAAEIIWPSIGRHGHPTDLITDWIMSFPKEKRTEMTRAALATSARLNAEFMANLLEESGVMKTSESIGPRIHSYMYRLRQRLGMNRAAVKKNS